MLQASLDKYEDLLKKARTARERLVILNEIKRLREDIAYLNTSLAFLSKQAQYSKLAITATQQKTGFDALSMGKSPTFSWVRELGPYRNINESEVETFEFATPDKFVRIDAAKFWMVESPTKAQVRATKLKNNPRGDSVFWQKAIGYYLAQSDNYESKKVNLSGFKGLMIQDKRDTNTSYLVAVKAEGEDIFLVEAVYPTAKDKKRFHKKVIDSFSKFKI